MSAKTSFFLTENRDMRVVCVEFSHPDLVQPIRYQNCFYEETLTAGGLAFDFKEFAIAEESQNQTLDQQISISINDNDDSFKNQYRATSRTQKIELKRWIYRETNLIDALEVFDTLYVDNISSDSKGVVTCNVSAGGLNNNKTGTLYTIEAYPLMKGLL